MDEFDLIRRYFLRSGGSGVEIGIGDDGAVLAPTPGCHLVQVVDTLVQDVHFPAALAPADLGYRAVAVNLSDIAAMGAVPRWMTLALSLPAADPAWLDAFANGLHEAAAGYGVTLVGGDTTRASEIVISVQLAGEIEPGTALRRDGARPGDAIYVTGTVGDAAAGLAALQDGRPVPALWQRFARPTPRVNCGRALIGHASAAIDVSDGLFGDLGKLLAASNAGARIDLDRLPLSDALRGSCEIEACRRYALAGGDDYELCFTAAGPLPDCGALPITAIGEVNAGSGIVCHDASGVVPYADPGYVHFTAGPGR